MGRGPALSEVEGAPPAAFDSALDPVFRKAESSRSAARKLPTSPEVATQHSLPEHDILARLA
jgi:hypothetical protein